jgi:hypothetical protein
MRSTSVKVSPEPSPAKMSSGPSVVVIAGCCCAITAESVGATGLVATVVGARGFRALGVPGVGAAGMMPRKCPCAARWGRCRIQRRMLQSWDSLAMREA